jgi:hypothetical protein
MKNLFITAMLMTAPLTASADYQVSDDRLLSMLEGLTDEKIETRICMGEDCFYLQGGYVWFTEHVWEAWTNKQHLFINLEVEFVDDYDDEIDDDFLDFKEPRIKPMRKTPRSGGRGNRSSSGHRSGRGGMGNRSGNNNGSGNSFKIVIGNGENGNKSCRSCHKTAHPGFGKK